jgi:predicted HNH restriction endonuclease
VLPFERNPPERNPPYLDCHDLKGKGFHVDQLVGCCTTEIDKDTFDGIKRRLDQAGARRLSTSASVLDTVKADLDSFRIEEEYVEGTPKTRFTNYYERNPKLRTAAIDFYGTRCMACGFDFGKYYGERGVGFIEVHHLRQVSTFRKRTKVDPQTDMAVVCSNCHRMIHRRKDRVLSLDDLKAKIRHAREFRKSRHN